MREDCIDRDCGANWWHLIGQPTMLSAVLPHWAKTSTWILLVARDLVVVVLGDDDVTMTLWKRIRKKKKV